MGGVKNLIGFRALTEEELTPGQTPSVRDTEAYLRFHRLWGNQADEQTFARYSSAPMLQPNEAAKQRIQSWLHTERRYPDRPLVIVCPYSNYPSRDMPDQTLLDFLPALAETGGVEIVLLGGTKDFDRAQSVISRLGIGLNACGVFSLQESAALLNACKLAICTESGPMHLASALGLSCLITFSRINASLHRWLPFRRDHTVLYRELECAGCRSFQCPVKGHPCMRDITSAQLLAAALSKLRGNLINPRMFGDTRIESW
jgi:ADP-heptose:LPS heptosyltransferase